MARLSDLMRMVLGGQTDGERLAALAAFERAMSSSGIDLHEVASRLDQTDKNATPPRDGAAFDAAFDDLVLASASIADHEWHGIASWILRQDANAPAIGHIRRPLNARQRKFVEQMVHDTKTLRPTARQGAYLLTLAAAISSHLSRAKNPPPERPRMPDDPGGDAQTERTADDGPTLSTRAPTSGQPALAAPACSIDKDDAAAVWAASKRGRRQPQALITPKDRLDWIMAIVAAQQRAPHPYQQHRMPALFTGEELRILIHLASMRAWRVYRRNKPPIEVNQQPAVSEIAVAARTTERSVRRAIEKAREAGYLKIQKLGGGRGKRTTYRIAHPHPRQWRGMDTRGQGLHHGTS